MSAGRLCMTRRCPAMSLTIPRVSSHATSGPGWAAGVAGLVIWLDAVIAALVLRADEERVYVLGHPIGWVCAWRSQLHLPCPTCGMTRSLVFSLHGEIGRAWHMAPAGPVALYGALGLATALLAMAFIRPLH